MKLSGWEEYHHDTPHKLGLAGSCPICNVIRRGIIERNRRPLLIRKCGCRIVVGPDLEGPRVMKCDNHIDFHFAGFS